MPRPPHTPDDIDLQALIEEWKFAGGIRVTFAMTMRAVLDGASVKMVPAWIARVEKQRVNNYSTGATKWEQLVVLVSDEQETPAKLFRDLAALYERGSVPIT